MEKKAEEVLHSDEEGAGLWHPRTPGYGEETKCDSPKEQDPRQTRKTPSVHTTYLNGGTAEAVSNLEKETGI